MIGKRIKSLICLLIVSMMVFTSCSSGSKTEPNSAEGKDNAAAEATAARDDLNFAFIAESKELDPHKASDTLTYIVLLQIFDTLIKIEADGTLSPALAESWEISEDGKEILFTIKQDVKFHNGDIMTADDVAYSLNRSIASSYTSKFTAVMEKAEVVSENQVKLTLKNSYGPILYCLANPSLAVVSQKAVEAAGDKFGSNPIGTGPYKFIEWISGEKVVATRFDDYFKGPAPIKDITFKFITDTATAAIALENGEIDILHNPAKSDKEAQINNENLAYYETDSAYYYHISMNNQSGPFADKKVREAVSYAINREDIIIGGLEGNGSPVEVPMPPAAFGYDPDFKNNPYDPEKAKELLAEAGYPDGFTCSFKVNQAPMYSNPAQVIQQQLREVGINCEIELMERAAYLDDVTRNFNYDLSLYVITALIPDADYVCYTRLHSTMLGNGNNFTQTSIPALDEALDKGRSSNDEATRLEAYRKVNEIVKEEVPVVPVMTGKYAIVANKDLKGVSPSLIDFHYLHDYSWE